VLFPGAYYVEITLERAGFDIGERIDNQRDGDQP
jgi:hypothetical protein